MKTRPSYGPDHHLVDYILGITYEIWEAGGMELIRDYYAPDVEVYSLDGVVQSADGVVKASKATLAAFPDRLLFGEAVIWSREENGDLYSSHRISSPMTNLGDSRFGAATGKRVETMIIADCLVRDGKVVREWLVRDNLALVNQLGIDSLDAAKRLSQSRDASSEAWRVSEISRLEASPDEPSDVVSKAHRIASRLLGGLWQTNAADPNWSIATTYAPYAVLHRSPVEYYSGRSAVLAHYQEACGALTERRVSLDHVAARPFDDQGLDLAARWTMRCTHTGPYLGLPASGRTLLVLGLSHWRLLEERVVREWTAIDGLGLLSQMLD